MTPVLLSRTRKLITYSDHWHTASTLDSIGRDNPEGSYHQFLASIVFRAFALESFLNHIGGDLFESWSDLERLSTKGKINVIAEKAGLKPNFGEMPWQIEPKLTAIRNKIAHGKNELLRDERELSSDTYDQEMRSMLKADWQEFATAENSIMVQRQLEQLMINLWMAAGHEPGSLFLNGMQFGSTEIISK